MVGISFLLQLQYHGMQNQVADSLSCYYEYDTIEDEYPNSEFIKADEILALDGDLAPIQQFIEI